MLSPYKCGPCYVHILLNFVRKMHNLILSILSPLPSSSIFSSPSFQVFFSILLHVGFANICESESELHFDNHIEITLVKGEKTSILKSRILIFFFQILSDLFDKRLWVSMIDRKIKLTD